MGPCRLSGLRRGSNYQRGLLPPLACLDPSITGLNLPRPHPGRAGYSPARAHSPPNASDWRKGLISLPVEVLRVGEKP